ncbi:hypothetical protein [Planococcus sp. ISL-109]|uniref:hypothetical protein n=1 Tax=Planococcus sp. ISL-109 TaxID=2819166 RepID=UPI001BE6D053|nr:hypothetical protein [Planococcus sp. ISL-109]MBT2581925.1 hypothetical protein [Planococcus sp. ISL-109]
METEWVLGIAASTIAAVSGMAIANKRSTTKIHETQEQAIVEEFVSPFLPEVISFHQLGTLGEDPFKTVNSEKLVVDIYAKSQVSGYHSYDRFDALTHIEMLGESAGEKKKELLEFLFWYLDFANAILTDTVQSPNTLLREVRQLQKHYAVWYICYEEMENDAPDIIPELIRYSAYYASVLREIEMGVFRDLMQDEQKRRDRRGNFVRIIFQALEKQADGKVELSAVAQFHQHYDQQYTHRNKGKIRF